MKTQLNTLRSLGSRHSAKFLVAGLSVCMMLNCGTPEEERTAVQSGSVAESQSALYVKGSSIWSSLQIPVCWENAAAGSPTDRDIVRKAVADTWEAQSDVSFTGWGSCTIGSKGVRIRISDEHPHVVALGDGLDGLLNGMVLNFTFRNWGNTCPEDNPRCTPRCVADPQGCIRIIAVHEFGHALGFAHEQNRSDTPGWCDEEQGSDGDITIGAWDLDSVMNYCNPKWSGDGNLSTTDVAGLRTFYLGWQFSSGGTGPWQSLNSSNLNLADLGFGDFNGDGKTDVFRASGTAWYVSNTGTWTQINTSGYTADSLRFGDFNGDGKTDVFRASGTAWYVSYSGTGGWTYLNGSSYLVDSLRFEDFNGDGKTDVFRAGGSGWYVSYSGTGGWTQINTSGYTADSLRFGDVNGN